MNSGKLTLKTPLLPLKTFALSDFIGLSAPTIKFDEFLLRDITRQKSNYFKVYAILFFIRFLDEHCMLFVALMNREEDFEKNIQCKMTGICPVTKVLLNGVERPPLFKISMKQVKSNCI